VALAFLIAPLALRTASAQSNRDQARQHFANGKRYFSQKKYRLAIGEFVTANKLAPSAVLYFNIGLAYDRIGDKRAALQSYRDYLRGVPKAVNNAQVQAKIKRLEGELRAEEAARKKAAAEEANRKAAEAAKRRAEEEARKKAAAKKTVPIPPPPGTTTTPPTGPSTTPKVAAKPPGTTTDPSTAAKQPPMPPEPVAKPKPPAATGDPELDKVASINIGALRAKRDGVSSPDKAAGPGADPTTEPKQRGDSTAKPLTDSKPKKPTPAYKQWWFWVVVGVSAVILVDILSTDSSSTAGANTPAMGATILRF